ncbi:MAG TPA: DNA-deoxyinosine glycosylase [Anaerovoracaceae bacterium]|nr:DNA-deoxyinosine glycosylase [Anaerovoracaceae bacterium]
MTAQMVYHKLEPVYDRNSRILILGTMPSPKSREFGFYYSHPQNKLWKVIPEVFQEPAPESNEAKVRFLKEHNIAMWDVLRSCIINGADDSTIMDPEPNDINLILTAAEIRAVFTTGKKATDLYRKLCYPDTGRPSIYLPSTSPANCRNYNLESLVEAYRVILKHL